MKAADAVAQLLSDYGVTQAFGLMGDANMDYLSVFIEQNPGSYLPAIDERSAVAMASGYSRTTGKIGVVSVTHGPGAANTVGPLIEAVRANDAVLLLTGDTPSNQPSHAQDIDLAGLFSATGAAFHRVRSSSQLVADITRALHFVDSMNTPMVLNIPVDFLTDDVDYVGYQRSELEHSRLQPTPDALDNALGALVQSSRPLVLAGRGAVRSDARDSLIALADKIGAPLATSVGGKDLFFGHPYDLGVMGGLSHPWAAEVIAQADCIISFGASLNDFTTMTGGFLSDKTLIQCDTSASSFDRWCTPDFSVLGDATSTATAMVEMLEEAEYKAENPFRERVLDECDIRERSNNVVDASGAEPLSPQLAAHLIDRHLPTDRVIVMDTGRFAISVWKHVHAEQPTDFVHTLTWAAIGLGLSTAIGVSVANKHRLTAALVGDGGGMMGLIELATAVKAKLPLAVFVFNDSAYGAEYMKLEEKGIDVRHSFIDLPDFVAVAQGLGASAVQVNDRAELERALEGVSTIESPTVFNIILDPAAEF